MSRSSALLCLLALLVSSGCQDISSPVYTLDRPRILALRSDPVDLVTSGAATLDALLYLPPGSAEPQYAWSWCGQLGQASTSYECALTSATLTSALDSDGSKGVSISYDLGTSSSAVFNFPVSVDILTSLCTASASSTGGSTATPNSTVTTICRSPWTVTMLLTVTVGQEQLRAIRDLNIYREAPSTTDTNPTISGLSIPAATVTQTDGSSLPPGSIGLLASAPQTDSLEGLTMAWYVESGQLGHTTTTLPTATSADARDWPSLLQNWWFPAASVGATEFIIVLRDSRNGVSWLRQKTNIVHDDARDSQ